ncbi:MAG: hypothetical protein HYY37_01895 [Candidatus Aenigmarchaeota archaeon]|nr:hypothetical protein [Candidatus Aenigmarchaeota archaeon]
MGEFSSRHYYKTSLIPGLPAFDGHLYVLGKVTDGGVVLYSDGGDRIYVNRRDAEAAQRRAIRDHFVGPGGRETIQVLRLRID